MFWRKIEFILWRYEMRYSKPPIFGKARIRIQDGNVTIFFLKPVTP